MSECVCVGVCVGVVCVYVCVLCILHGRVCVCVNLYADHKQAQHSGTARYPFEKSTVKTILWQKPIMPIIGSHNIVFYSAFFKIYLAVPAC